MTAKGVRIARNENKPVLQTKSGLWVRKGTWDERVWSEQQYYRGLIVGGETLLDLGANIGASARWALKEGASDVICVEPEPTNFKLLKLNVLPLNQNMAHTVTCLKAAVVPGRTTGPTIKLYLNQWSNPAAHSILPVKGRPAIKVPTIGLLDLLDTYHPTALKIDIEGAEYALLDDLLASPKYVKRIAVEVHLTISTGQRALGEIFVDEMNKKFDVLKAPKPVATAARNVQGIWQRRSHA
jgi:FkbM family methyltransferase